MSLSHQHSGRPNRLITALRQLYGARRKVATCGAVVLAGVVGYHVVFGQNGLTAYRNKRQIIQDMNSEMHGLQTQNQMLRNHVQRLTSDPNAIEHEAREALHYARPGEVIYTLPDLPRR